MATETTSETTAAQVGTTGSVVGGAVGGLVGGVVFGVLMQMMDMIPMVAALVGGSSLALGWVVHLGISVFFGVAFGLLAGRWLGSVSTSIAAGVGYGLALWVIGPLLLMPAKLGMPTFEFSTTVWQSLMGHLVFGALLGVTASLVSRRLSSRA